MTRMVRMTATTLAVALLAACGAKPLSPTVQPAAGMLGAQSVTTTAAINALIARGKALQGGFSSAVLAERVHIYNQLAHSNSDAAANFLLAELGLWESWPESAQNVLETPLLAALNRLAADDKTVESAEDFAAEAAGKKKHGRKFNIWDGINRFFGVKKKHHHSGGGSGPGPAPAPAGDPAGGGGDPSGGGAAPDPAGGGDQPPAPPAGG